MDREASHASVHRVSKSQTRLSDWSELKASSGFTLHKFSIFILNSFYLLSFQWPNCVVLINPVLHFYHCFGDCTLIWSICLALLLSQSLFLVLSYIYSLKYRKIYLLYFQLVKALHEERMNQNKHLRSSALEFILVLSFHGTLSIQKCITNYYNQYSPNHALTARFNFVNYHQ